MKTKNETIKKHLNHWYKNLSGLDKEMFDNCNFKVSGLIEDIKNDLELLPITRNNVIEAITNYIYE